MRNGKYGTTVELAVGVFHDERRSFLVVYSGGVNVEK